MEPFKFHIPSESKTAASAFLTKITREHLIALGFTSILNEEIGEYGQHWFVACNPKRDLRIAINLGQRRDVLYFTLEGPFYFRGKASVEVLIALMALNSK